MTPDEIISLRVTEATDIEALLRSAGFADAAALVAARVAGLNAAWGEFPDAAPAPTPKRATRGNSAWTPERRAAQAERGRRVWQSYHAERTRTAAEPRNAAE